MNELEIVSKRRPEPWGDRFRYSLGYVTVRVLWTCRSVDVAPAYHNTEPPLGEQRYGF